MSEKQQAHVITVLNEILVDESASDLIDRFARAGLAVVLKKDLTEMKEALETLLIYESRLPAPFVADARYILHKMGMQA